jgi:undecaprenyl-diphosphatase
MTFLSAAILGLIEGLTEFLPISSTGHLIIAGKLLALPSTAFLSSFDIAIQSGAILAVVYLFAGKLLSNKHLLGKVTAAFIPTAIVGFVIYKLFKTYLAGNLMVTIAALLVGGIFLIWFERYYRDNDREEAAFGLEKLNYGQAMLIGLAQALAIIPGVSRSAATIIGGMALGLSRQAVVEFSFLLAIPTMLAATAYDLYKNAGTFAPDQFGYLAVGFAISFAVALWSVKFLIRYIQKNDFTAFGYYRIIVAILAYLILL